MSSEKIRKMIFRSSLVITALLGLFFIKNFNQKPPVNDKEALILQGIMETTKYVHLTPKTIDNSFSAFVYKTYLDRIDFQKRFLTQQDIDKLKVFEQQIDEQTNNRTFEFFNASLPMLDAGVLKGKKYFSEFIDQPMNFSKGDVIETDADKRMTMS